MAPLPLIDVTTFRLPGVDDATALRDAVDAAVANGISIIYFPPGEYRLGAFEGGPSLVLADLRCLTFLGEGDCSVLRRIDAAGPEQTFSSDGILTLENCTGVTFQDLAVDLDGFQPSLGSPQRAVIELRGCSQVCVQNLTFSDSGSRVALDLTAELHDVLHPERISHHFDTAHHLALRFESGEDVAVRDCRFLTAGLAVSGGTRVTIADNLFQRSHGHAIAVGSSAPDVTHRDVEIVGNVIESPLCFGIVVADIPPAPVGQLAPSALLAAGMDGVRIEGNVVRKPAPAMFPRGIVVGLLHFAHEGDAAPDTKYTNVVVRDNSVDLTTGLARPQANAAANTFPSEARRVAGIWLQVPAAESVGSVTGEGAAFERAVVTRNLIRGARYDEAGDGAGVVAITLRRSVIAGNGLYDCDVGLLLGAAFATHVHDNRAQARRRAYECGFSASNAFSGNATLADGEDTRWLIGGDGGAPGAEERFGSTFTGGDAPGRA